MFSMNTAQCSLGEEKIKAELDTFSALQVKNKGIAVNNQKEVPEHWRAREKQGWSVSR